MSVELDQRCIQRVWSETPAKATACCCRHMGHGVFAGDCLDWRAFDALFHQRNDAFERGLDDN